MFCLGLENECHSAVVPHDDSTTCRCQCVSPLTSDHPWCYTYCCFLPHVVMVIWSIPKIRMARKVYCLLWQHQQSVTGNYNKKLTTQYFYCVLLVISFKFTFTFRAFSRHFYPKRLTISTFVTRSASIYRCRYRKDVHRTKCKYQDR